MTPEERAARAARAAYAAVLAAVAEERERIAKLLCDKCQRAIGGNNDAGR